MSITFCIEYLNGMWASVTCMFIMRVIQNKSYNSTDKGFKYDISLKWQFAQNCSKKSV